MKKLALILATSVAALGAAKAADGKALYNTCTACHQADGKGLPGAFPPLAESEWVNGPVENLIRIQLRGLMGPIEVKGATYNSAMPPNAAMSDEDIAAVLTYVRSNFGNNSGPVTADQVKALRSEVGKPMLTAADLVDPKSAPKVEEKPAAPATEEKAEKKTEAVKPATSQAAPAPTSGKVTASQHVAGPNKLVIGGFLGWAAICSLPVIAGFARN